MRVSNIGIAKVSPHHVNHVELSNYTLIRQKTGKFAELVNLGQDSRKCIRYRISTVQYIIKNQHTTVAELLSTDCRNRKRFDNLVPGD